ncbi:MAG: hypothetical protein JNL28_15895 [Planctomycetes bacterium]|nr:hypothetical protein [Planctomycetota bacterium]
MSRAPGRRGFLTALLAASACLPAAAQARAQPLVERLELEGALDNDTDLARDAAAHAALVAGDEALQKAGDANAPVAALEHWRRALQISSPLSAVEADARRTISIGAALRARLTQALRAEFRARFAGSAEVALAKAGLDEAALERVAHEYPFTRAGLLAELRRFDLAAERGAIYAARSALKQAEIALESNPDLAAALGARRAFLPRPPDEDSEPDPVAGARALRLAAMIDLGSDPALEPDRMLEPSGVAHADGRVFCESGERLIEIAPDGTHSVFEPRRLAVERGARASWLPIFGDQERPWTQRPALAGNHLALVLGRARETRGNALALFDVSATPPRLVWLHTDLDAPAFAPLPGRLEFQPGPITQAGLVVVQVLQWEQPGAPPELQTVADTHVSAWLVAFEIQTGQKVWQRRLASGSDRRGRALRRFGTPRGSSIASPPLIERAGVIWAATELGVVAAVELDDGRLVESLALKRVRTEPTARPGWGGPFFVDSGKVACSPADAERWTYVLGARGAQALRIAGLERLVGGSASGLTALVRDPDRRVLVCLSPASGARVDSLPFARGAAYKGGFQAGERVWSAVGETLYLHAVERDLELVARLDLAGLALEPHTGVWSAGSRVYVVGAGRIWVVESE